MTTSRPSVRLAALAAIAALALCAAARAQGPRTFDALPGAERYRLVSRSLGELAVGGRVRNVEWLADGSGVAYTRGGERFRLDLATGTEAPFADEAAAPRGDRPRAFRGRVARGQQASVERSPDGRWEAACVDDNVVLRPVDRDEPERPVTTDGHRKLRYGRASWVYGEELDQTSAMWWSPDGSRLAFYAFDERDVPDYYLLDGLVELRTSPVIEGYPKPGDPNPVAGLVVHDLERGTLVRVDVGEGGGDQYVYNVQWTPDGSELLFSRTNRRQDRLEVLAADPVSGRTRLVVAEEQPTWQNNRPLMRFLEDGRRFVWESERTGWAQYELRDLDGRLLHPLTRGDRPVDSIVRLDEGTSDGAGWLWYAAYTGDNPLDLQLHRVRLDGTGEQRLTPGDLNYGSFDVSPDGRWLVTTGEAVDAPPTTFLFDDAGARVATLAASSTARMEELGLPMPELVSLTAADGETDLYGILYKPSGFDPSRSYPLLVNVYGGPSVRTVANRFVGADPACELGMLVLRVDNRGTPGRGKAFESAAYLQLGVVDLDDQAAAVRQLAERPYVDASRVAITGGSYGGYLSALALLRHPDVFAAAVAVSAVTDWRNYDSIYTERYMRTPAENPDGYDAGSCVRLAGNLRGALLLMHGMADENVHPANAWQLAHALQQADLPFEMMLFPTFGHGVFGPAANSAKWTFLCRELGLLDAPR